MQVQVLGPLNAKVDGACVVPTADKPRRILALLALCPGQVVPVPAMMEEIWGTRIPLSAMTTLQTYILQLRRLLGAAMGAESGTSAKELLATRYGGYVLRIPPGAVDVHAYESLAEGGLAAFEAGHDERAADLFRRALGLWDGPALVNVRLGPCLQIEATRLEESRLMVTERRIDAELRLGRHTRLLAEITALIARHPQHEGLHAQAMVALYRSGRLTAALEVYRGLHRSLVEGLGVEPSPRLQRLHRAMLALDPQLDVPAGPRHTSTFDLYPA